MNSQRVFLVPAILLIVILLILTSSFSQVKKGEMVSHSGTIKSISKDLRIVVVNDVNVLISPETKIFDEKGNTLKIDKLKPKLYVVVEGFENTDGILAKKIVIKELRGV
jgi:hypothetical protein